MAAMTVAGHGAVAATIHTGTHNGTSIIRALRYDRVVRRKLGCDAEVRDPCLTPRHSITMRRCIGSFTINRLDQP